MAEDYSNKLTVADLDTCERMMKNHLTSVMAKLRTRARTHVVIIIVRLG